MKTIGFLIDPPGGLDRSKDSSIELMRAADAAGCEVVIFTCGQMHMKDSLLHIDGLRVQIASGSGCWLRDDRNWSGSSRDMDAIMLRLEPPIDERFRHACTLLAVAGRQQTPVFNDPQAVLIGEEKISALLYPQFSPPTMVSTSAIELIEFAGQLPDGCVVKKLGGMGGQGVFAFAAGDSNIAAAISHITQSGAAALVQQRLADIASGDRRVFVIDGQPAEVMLNRLPAPGCHLANMAAGGRPVAMPIQDREREIASALGADLKAAGILFAGLDVVDGHLTEINISCPTGLVQARQQLDVDLAARIIERALDAG